ncbi:hypothetical protein F383_01326 [Gossypium arboreum]|uniref:Uncharacterized protein n=1 Tax=Gossypium arboreum TaxID=29729 RepID=A0A0B0PIK5_GOSAR|nr:hypothetical protein F383_01326 [Gossypium arboreum]
MPSTSHELGLNSTSSELKYPSDMSLVS